MRVVSWNVTGFARVSGAGSWTLWTGPPPISSASRRSAHGPKTSHRPPAAHRAGTPRSRSPSAGAIAVSASTRSSSPSGWTPPWACRGSTERDGSWPRTSRPPAGGSWWSTATSPREAARTGTTAGSATSSTSLGRSSPERKRCRRRGPVLVIGDYNTAHHAIDLARPQSNVTHSGFLPEERAELDRWIDAGWVDAFRALHPEAPDQYTWWRQWGGARERNIGWRIDYVFASPAAMRRIHEAFIWPDEQGSDHCPVGVDIDL